MSNQLLKLYSSICADGQQTYKKKYRQTDRATNKQKEKQTKKQKDRQTKRHINIAL